MAQVIQWEYVYKGDPVLYSERKCDWCGKKVLA